MLIDQDPGKILDELAILNVKLEKSSGLEKDKNIDNFTQLARQIIDNIGKTKYDEILNSDEYHDLYRENLEIFMLVDRLNGLKKPHILMIPDKVLAKIAIEINDRNYNRYLAKIAIQKKFFNTEISEVKIGYGK